MNARAPHFYKSSDEPCTDQPLYVHLKYKPQHEEFTVNTEKHAFRLKSGTDGFQEEEI